MARLGTDGAAPEPETSGARPWGLGVAAAAFGIILVTWFVGSEVVVALTSGLYDPETCKRTGHACDQLAYGIYGYQALALGALLAAAWIVLMRGKGNWSVLGFRFPGWGILL